MDNSKELATLETRHRMKTNKTKQKTAQHRKLKRWATRTSPKKPMGSGRVDGRLGEPMCSRRVSSSVPYISSNFMRVRYFRVSFVLLVCFTVFAVQSCVYSTHLKVQNTDKIKLFSLIFIYSLLYHHEIIINYFDNMFVKNFISYSLYIKISDKGMLDYTCQGNVKNKLLMILWTIWNI